MYACIFKKTPNWTYGIHNVMFRSRLNDNSGSKEVNVPSNYTFIDFCLGEGMIGLWYVISISRSCMQMQWIFFLAAITASNCLLKTDVHCNCRRQVLTAACPSAENDQVSWKCRCCDTRSARVDAAVVFRQFHETSKFVPMIAYMTAVHI